MSPASILEKRSTEVLIETQKPIEIIGERYNSEVIRFLKQPSLESKHKLYQFIKRELSIKINMNGHILPDQAIYVANHPKLNACFHIDSRLLPDTSTKTRYDYFHFPGIFQSAWHELICADPMRDFATAIKKIGYCDALSYLNCLVLPTEGGVGFISNEIKNNPHESIVIYPEGGCNNISKFRSGFYHVAVLSKIRDVVICHITEEPDFNQNLTITVIDKVEVNDFEGDGEKIDRWVDGVRAVIKDYSGKNQ